MTEDNAEIPLFATAMNMIEAIEAMNNIAKLVAALQKSLIEEGFSDRDALTLCGTWLAAATKQPGREQ